MISSANAGLATKNRHNNIPTQPTALIFIDPDPRVLNLLDRPACETQNEGEIEILILRFGPRPEFQIRPDAIRSAG